MDFVKGIIDFILHIDEYLGIFVTNYGGWTIGILFVIIFCETGLVFTPFLPGDSLLFAAGAIAALHPDALPFPLLLLLMIIAAILGDTANYWIGSSLGRWMLDRPKPLIKQEYIERTHKFFEKYGGKTIILARFVPIVRTFAPFVAGLGKMDYRHFLTFNVVGGVLWATLFLCAGYFFGQFEFVQKNFELVALAIILVSVLPIVVEFVLARMRRTERAA
ncbi:DedA family protein [Oscillochloris sp. ZM17-4]|uniref:DedA family protein n=1 Tax=Oscillochloris sp. ZM17-4 TaxID=2866714 RepID=UPI001C72EF37|nr:DedA family protein [Oscillochloris sp. ZM17-4]MBX0326714.1 DedA family protein [Oscillochloris sp. ZM17-4]